MRKVNQLILFFAAAAIFMFSSGCSNASNSSDSSGKSKRIYYITISQSEHGSVTPNRTIDIAAGERIVLTVMPDSGYALNTLFVKSGEMIIPVFDNAFIMPAGNVTVSATFEAISSSGETSTTNQSEDLINYLPAGTSGSAGSSRQYVTFGEWPQTVKAANVDINLNESKNAGIFTYYKGSDGAWYVQSAENCDTATQSVHTYSDGTNAAYASANSTKWFKVEPIKWLILSTNYDHDGNPSTSGKKILLAENILIGSVFYDYLSIDRTINGATVHPNSFEHSRVRAILNGLSYEKKSSNSEEQTTDSSFLNKGFLQIAFTNAERGLIATTTAANSDIQINGKIFILSREELLSEELGFNNSTKLNIRNRSVSDYALAAGVHEFNLTHKGFWWARNNFGNYNSNVYLADGEGMINTGYDVNKTNVGVAPVLCLE